MAKSARSSQIKANNRRLKKNVFGPIEAARNERLSAKLQELIAQPKPAREVEVEMEAVDEGIEDVAEKAECESMEVDGEKTATAPVSKKRVEKRRRGKKSGIVFPKYGEKRISKKK
ncbi:hypothetical protein B0T18DRAFT_316538 [Schizothecium vesticola]|uniref:DUF2423 domain-containing protein n=1 Tax=Schizothecium vesticola TaxID=314040 RepID=A0AA40F8G9_9PEZI|nr:hypothetical protein B0T18DRAFT_316538 [Schizothecium vesticola]